MSNLCTCYKGEDTNLKIVSVFKGCLFLCSLCGRTYNAEGENWNLVGHTIGSGIGREFKDKARDSV